MNISLSSCYNLRSGYSTILNCLISKLSNYEIYFYPRNYGGTSQNLLYLFDNIKLNEISLDLLLLPIGKLESTNPIIHIPHNKRRIFYTMWESSRMDDGIVDILHKFPSIVVPNSWNKNNFILQGVKSEINVIQLFANTEIFKYKENIISDKLIFACGNDDPRKCLNDTVKCFVKAFPDKCDVQLNVKSNTMPNILNKNIIKVCNTYLTTTALRDWYYDSNVFVSGASAEGWGMMQQESMCCGRPVIASIYAGLSEFMNDANGFGLKFDEVPSDGYWENPGGKWSKYKEESMIEMMRYCYNNPDEIISKGKLASIDASKFTEDLFLTRLIDLIKTYEYS